MWPPTGQYQQKYLVETSVSILKKQQMLRWSPFFFIHCPFLHPSALNTDMIPGTWAVILKYENEDHTWWDFLFSYLVSSGTRSDRMNMGTWRGHFNTLNCLSPVFLNRRREIKPRREQEGGGGGGHAVLSTDTSGVHLQTQKCMRNTSWEPTGVPDQRKRTYRAHETR